MKGTAAFGSRKVDGGNQAIGIAGCAGRAIVANFYQYTSFALQLAKDFVGISCNGQKHITGGIPYVWALRRGYAVVAIVCSIRHSRGIIVDVSPGAPGVNT